MIKLLYHYIKAFVLFDEGWHFIQENSLQIKVVWLTVCLDLAIKHDWASKQAEREKDEDKGRHELWSVWESSESIMHMHRSDLSPVLWQGENRTEQDRERAQEREWERGWKREMQEHKYLFPAELRWLRCGSLLPPNTLLGCHFT